MKSRSPRLEAGGRLGLVVADALDLALLELECDRYEILHDGKLGRAHGLEHRLTLLSDLTVVALPDLGRRLGRCHEDLAAVGLVALPRHESPRFQAIDERGYRGRREADRLGDRSRRLRPLDEKGHAMALGSREAEPLAHRLVEELRRLLPAHEGGDDLPFQTRALLS